MQSCPACGAPASDEAAFCSACGTNLPGGEAPQPFRKVATVLFSDVVGSTALGELLDPETLSEVMRAYFGAMRPVIETHGGAVAKFIGDAVMAVCGIPASHEDAALRAVRAASDMRKALTQFNRGLPARLGGGDPEH